MKYLLYFIGFVPSILWLLFYLRKDAHPESNKMVLKVFLLGMVSGLFAIVFEKGFQKTQNIFLASLAYTSAFSIFIGGAFIEEIVKYASAKFGTYRNAELDEPVDFILYMIISALGFAALENILVLTNYHPILNSTKVLELMLWRFASATFLHALCSGIFGYFLALSFFYGKKRKLYFLYGLTSCTILHGLYNFSIIRVEGLNKFIVPLIILGGATIFLSFGFKKLKKIKSICYL